MTKLVAPSLSIAVLGAIWGVSRAGPLERFRAGVGGVHRLGMLLP